MARDVMAEVAAFTAFPKDWELELPFDLDDPASVVAANSAMEDAIDSRALRS